MMEWKSMGFGWHPISEMENLTCLKPPTRKCPANHGYDMIFYCEPFYQLASLGHIRLAGLPEKIFQDCTVTWLDRMRTPKATKTQQKIGKKKLQQYLTKWFSVLQPAWRPKSAGLIIMFPTKWVSQTRGFFTRLPHPNKSDFGYTTSKYSHEVLPLMRPNWWLVPVTR